MANFAVRVLNSGGTKAQRGVSDHGWLDDLRRWSFRPIARWRRLNKVYHCRPHGFVARIMLDKLEKWFKCCPNDMTFLKAKPEAKNVDGEIGIFSSG
jgi:hypothetical protein